MAIIRRKKVFDGIDREILRCLHQSNPKPMVSRNIAKCVGRTPSAISPRLNNLKTQGIIRQTKITGLRQFNRQFGNKLVKVSAPRSIFWGLDLKKPKRRK